MKVLNFREYFNFDDIGFNGENVVQFNQQKMHLDGNAIDKTAERIAYYEMPFPQKLLATNKECVFPSGNVDMHREGERWKEEI